MRKIFMGKKVIAGVIGAFGLLGVKAGHAAPEVVVSIKPLHGLVSQVMAGVGEPTLLIEGAASPHGYSLKPSQAQRLQQADLVFWVGPELESFLAKPLASLPAKARTVALAHQKGIVLLESDHDHGDHGHDDHKDEHHHDEEAHHDHDEHKEHGHKDEHHHEEAHHDHEEHKDHDHEEHHEEEAHKEHVHKEEGHHDHGSIDPHVWLDPHNAETMVRHIAESLIAQDPEQAAIYRQNMAKALADLEKLDQEIKGGFAGVKVPSYVVFHDAYGYFENRYGLKHAGAIAVNPEIAPSAKQVHHIRHELEEAGAACLFSEPQFTPKIMSVIAEGLPLYQGVLDPLGASHDAGPDAYHQTLRAMAAAFQACAAKGL